MSKLRGFLNFIGHYKYLIVIVGGIALVGFLDENSYLHRMQLDMQISDLKDEIRVYEEKNAESMKRIAEIDSGGLSIEKIARENYYMKSADEDIFVLSSDMDTKVTKENETTE